MNKHELNSKLKNVIGELKELMNSDMEMKEGEWFDEEEVKKIKNSIREVIYKLEDNLS